GIVAGNNRGECIIWLQEGQQRFTKEITQALTYRPNLDAWIRKIFYNKPYFLIVSQMGLYQLQIGKKPVQIFPQYYGFKVAAPIDDSTYWLGTHGHLFICRFRQQRYTVGIVYAGKRITAIAPVSDHECYVGSNDGLYHWLNGKMRKVHLSGYVGSQKVHALARDARGWIWVAYGGDSLLAFQHDAIKLLMKTGEHFPGDIIKCLLADGEMLWVGTNNCLGKIQLDVSSPPKVRTTFFSVLDGLAGEQVNDIQRYGQYLYVATSDGVSYFPKSFTIAARDIPVYIMNMYTSRHQLADLEKPITLSYRENYIRFDLSAVDYSGLPEIWFRYRLNNHHWVFSRNPVINLYELPPGRYTLSVQAIRRDGMPSAKIATVSFEIRAPFFVKPLFWFAMVLAVLGVSAYMLWRIYRRKHRQRLMQLEQQRKITELEMQMLRAQINPHFIFNTLNAIKQMMYEHEVDQANHYLDQFSSLLRANLYTHQDDIISLEQELLYVEQYLTLEKLRFGDQFDYEIHTDESINMSSVQVPAMMLQPVVENAIKHGIRKQKHVRGKIYILVQMQGSCCQIHILDNGPGFQPLTATAGGKGLEITRKRAEWHGLQFSLSRIVWQDQLFTAAIFQIPLSHTQIVCQPSSVVTS
ncbi:MAG: histidine kinase, partial [Thermoflavifilum sp.]|nr:histidine kinase [Thermoflavifilum sp.]